MNANIVEYIINCHILWQFIMYSIILALETATEKILVLISNEFQMNVYLKILKMLFPKN